MTSHSVTRRVHFIEFAVIVTLGLVSSIIIIVTSGYSFIGFPQVCIINSLSGYLYAQLLPVTIGFSTAVVLIYASAMVVRNVSFCY